MAKKAKYTFINKSVVPRPFKGNILRFNEPVTTVCELTKEEEEYLKKSGIVFIKGKEIETKKDTKAEPGEKSTKKSKSKEHKDSVAKNDEDGTGPKD